MADTMISAGGGLSKSKLALANAALSDVLSGKTFYAGDKTLHTGTMHNNGRWPDAEKLTLEGSKIWMYQKQNGYLEGGLGIDASTLGNASPGHVLSGVSASSSNGLKFGGTMANRGSISATLNPGDSKYYSAGYYSGGTVTCRSATSVIKTTTLNIVGTWGNDTASASAPGTIVGIKSMQRNGNSNPPYSISTSGSTLSVEWGSHNGSLNLSFSVAYI